MTALLELASGFLAFSSFDLHLPGGVIKTVQLNEEMLRLTQQLAPLLKRTNKRVTALEAELSAIKVRHRHRQGG